MNKNSLIISGTVRLDQNSWFYKNCKNQRKNKAKICDTCPFRTLIEKAETENI